MTDGFQVDAQQIRDHAAKVDEVQQRFGAVKAASAAIAQDDAAYGMLCGWMSAILEGRHASQNSLYAYVEENLSLAADALLQAGRDYADVDDVAADRIRRAGGL